MPDSPERNVSTSNQDCSFSWLQAARRHERCRLAGSCPAGTAQPRWWLCCHRSGATLNNGCRMLWGQSSLPSPSEQEGTPYDDAKPFCLLKISKFGACHAKILVEACVLLFGEPLKCLELLQSPQELPLTRCSGKWLSGPWCRSLSRLAEPVEGCWILQPGVRLCSAPTAAKASVCWPRVHEDVMEGLQGTCSRLLCSQCWTPVLDLTTSLPPARL